MLRVGRILLYSLILICPACSRGRMFRGMFKMNVRCPVCGVIFERDYGEITGGMAINVTLTSLFAIVFAAITVFGNLPFWLSMAGITVFTVLFPLWFYRHARGLWVGILYITGSMFED